MGRLVVGIAVVGAAVCAWYAAVAATAVPPAATVRCTGALNIRMSFDPAKRLTVADYTRPADGTAPQPTGRTFLSMAYNQRSLNPACRAEAPGRRPDRRLMFGPYPRSNAGRIFCLASPGFGFQMRLSQIRNKKRAVVGTRLLIIQGSANRTNIIFEARLQRNSGGVWFDSDTCQRRTSSCPPYAPPGAGCAAKAEIAAAPSSRARRTARARTT
jgi:hypothetical protein